MEKVQFQLEATLPELKDLHGKGLFAKNEIDQITKRRTAFETSLIRRQTRKEDFFKYAEYEINLERLRKVRWRRLKYHINPPPPSASTYSLPRRASYILKRATVKFPGDLAVWLAYVEYASREGMRKVVLKGLNSALHHHPLSSTLYLLLSYHHLHPNSPFPGSSIPSTSKLDLPSAGDDDDEEEVASGFSLEGTASARTNILLGLRMIPRSHDLWREYIKLELGWVEGLRRRWQVLGVNIEPKAGVEVDPDALTGGEGSFGPEGEDARKAILSGQLALHAIKSALAGISPTDPLGMQFRQSLLDMLRIYPSALRTKCLEAVYDDLGRISEDAGKGVLAQAKFAHVTKDLYDRLYDPERKDEGGVVLEGEQLVDALGKIGKEIRAIAKRGDAGQEWLELSGSWLAQQIALCGDNDNLHQYLLSILTTLTKSAYNPPASLLIRHLALLQGNGSSPDVIIKTARSHAAQYPSNPILQLARLDLERSSDTDPETLRKAFKSAFKVVRASDLSLDELVAVRAIWSAYLDWEEEQSSEDVQRIDGIYRKALRDTLRQGTADGLHDAILVRYLEVQVRRGRQEILPALQQVASTYRPNHTFFTDAFDLIAEQASAPHADLRVAYRLWRAASDTNEKKVSATLRWAGWLLRHKHGKEAADAVDIMRREVGQDATSLATLEREWAAALDSAERRNAATENSVTSGDEDVDMSDNGSEPSER